jgi:hypothetical protein
MGETLSPAVPNLLHYRPWRGTFRGPHTAVWAIARVGLAQMFRRKLFWGLYALGLMIFLLFFFGQYLLAWAETQSGESSVRVGGLGQANPKDLIGILRYFLKLDGSAETFKNFFGYQGYMIMIVLALAGSLLIGNDLRFGSLPFYLSKPLAPRHYLFGKGLAVAVFINMMTTVPALALFVQYGLLDSWSYFWKRGHLFVGILGYGAVLTLTLTLLLLATATWLRRTVPLIMTWTTLFIFCRLLANALADERGLQLDPNWRLFDLWGDTYVVGLALLGLGRQPTYPAWPAAALVLGGVCLLCLSYLSLRVRAVEVVR